MGTEGFVVMGVVVVVELFALLTGPPQKKGRR